MQLIAMDEKGRSILAKNASKQVDYECMECGQKVRLRAGVHRQKHFYHIEPREACRQAGKGMVHLQIQLAIQEMLCGQNVKLEVRFESINRIADVVWEEEKLIIEVQCSGITAAEIEQRNRDYGTLGYEVVWVLHANKYLAGRKTGAQYALAKHAHYYTDIDERGQGGIFDLLPCDEKSFKDKRATQIKIDKIVRMQKQQHRFANLFKKRTDHWKVRFADDLFEQLNQQAVDSQILQEAMALEKLMAKEAAWQKLNIVWRIIEKCFLRPYKITFQILLERSCR